MRDDVYPVHANTRFARSQGLLYSVRPMSERVSQPERESIWSVPTSLWFVYHGVFAGQVALGVYIIVQRLHEYDKPLWHLESVFYAWQLLGPVVLVAAASTIVTIEILTLVAAKIFGFWSKSLDPTWRDLMVLGTRIWKEVQDWRRQRENTPIPTQVDKASQPPPIYLPKDTPDGLPDVPTDTAGSRSSDPPPRLH